MIKKLGLLKNEAVKQGLVELGRVALIAVLPLLVVQLESGKFDLKIILVAGVIALLKSIDRAVHVYGKSIEKEGWLGEKGLTGF